MNPSSAIICPDETEMFDYVFIRWIYWIFDLPKFVPVPVNLN